MAKQIYGRFHAIFRVYCVTCRWLPEHYGDHDQAAKAGRAHEAVEGPGHASLVEARSLTGRKLNRS